MSYGYINIESSIYLNIIGILKGFFKWFLSIFPFQVSIRGCCLLVLLNIVVSPPTEDHYSFHVVKICCGGRRHYVC